MGEEQRQHRLEHHDVLLATMTRVAHSATSGTPMTVQTDEASTVRCRACGLIREEPRGAGEREHGDEGEWNRHAAGLVQPSAERRPNHDSRSSSPT